MRASGWMIRILTTTIVAICGWLLVGRALTRRRIWRMLDPDSIEASRLRGRARGSSLAGPDRTGSRWSSNPNYLVKTRGEKVVLVMVGLPARGKSYISQALIRYLNWFGCRSSQFNAGDRRREQGKAGVPADYYDTNNKKAHAEKEQIAMETLQELLTWLTMDRNDTAVGIFDATNTTVARRQAVIDSVRTRDPDITVLFLESLCQVHAHCPLASDSKL